MKKNIHILGVSLLLILASCQKLDRDFVTTIDKDQFLSTYGLISGLINSIYAELPDGTLYINGNAMMASATDEAEFTQDPHPVQLFNTGSWNAINNPDNGSNGTSNANTTIWAQYYRGIRKANQLIVSTGLINNDQFKNDPSASGQVNYAARLAEIRRWTFEARFLRAYFYFELVKRYGGVPLITKELSINDDISQFKRNTLEECINFIVSECDAAVPELPPYPALPTGYIATDLGRATKFAPLALKSRVLLYAASDLFNNTSWASGYSHPELIALPTGDRNARWKLASDAAKAFIDAKTTDPQGPITTTLPTAYKTVFNVFNNAEIVFYRNTAASNTFEKTNYPIGYPSGNSGNTPSQNLVDAYEMKTTGKAISDPASGYDPNNPYANRDPRLALTIVTNGSSFGTPSRIVQIYNGGSDGPPINFATKTGYYLRKYVNESLNLSTNQTSVHSWIIFRVPEMFLNYAEALNEWSPGNPDIKKYVDIIRSRTGVAMPGMPAGLSQSDARDKIRNERMVELAFEDHRAWDTRRWMIAPATLGSPLRGMTITGTGSATAYQVNTVESRVFTAKMYLYPIPQSEINISPVLIQNPLW